MNKNININNWETIKIIPKERYFIDEDNQIQEKLNIYQNQLLDKGELYKIDSNHAKVIELSEKIIMNPITYEIINIPWISILDLKNKQRS